MAKSPSTNQALIEAIRAYSVKNAYIATLFGDSVCNCGNQTFTVLLDDNEGCAARTCVACEDQQPIADGEEYLDEADLGECACPCGQNAFEVTAGVSLYDDSTDVKWFYLGLRCPSCELAAVYGDWKCEAGDAQVLLASM
jgi:hypothetical protein